MRYCQRCALNNEWTMPLTGELTALGKCESCGVVAPCAVVADESEAQMRYPRHRRP